MIAMDDSKYAEARRMLVQFPKSFAGTPEVEGAKALLSEIDAAYAKRAEEALSAARAGASAGKFDEAESDLRSIKGRFGDGPWLESKGEAAVAEALAAVAKQRSEWELKNVAGTLQKAREELRSDRFEEAGKLIANRAEWPADYRTKADELAAEIERAVAAAAAAKKLALERAAVLAKFDRLMTSGEYAGARHYAKLKAAAGGEVAEILRGGEDLARRLTEEPAARLRGARTLVGRKVRLKLAKGHMTGIVKAATETELVVATTYTINRQTRERRNALKWSALHSDQKAELARLGGLKLGPGNEAIVAAYAALASDDLDAAGRSAGAAGDAPLGNHLVAVVRTRLNRRAYESAMRRARELVEKKKLKDAARECEKALGAMPDDGKASALLAELRRRLAAPKTLTLDLGNGVTMELVYVKPGTFVMGGESTTEGRFHAVETPKHTVALTKGYYLGKYEVTQAQYQTVMGKNPSKSTREPNCPVDNVSWQDANAFCKRAAEKTGREVRLPTEAEWEHACRAGTDTEWSHGSDPAKLGEYAWISGNSGGRSHPVGQKKPNPWGFYDIHGNVCERVADMYHRDYYANSPKEDPTGADVRFAARARGTSILRGGTWKEGPDGSRSGKRLRGGGYGFYDDWGFRAAVTPAGKGDTGTPTIPETSKTPTAPKTPATPKTPGEEVSSRPKTPHETGRNIVVNGGFEEISPQTKFPVGWKKRQWGTGAGRWSVSTDRTNPRTGDRAIVVRPLDDGLMPGAYCVLSMEPGAYEVTYWACADVDKRAGVAAHCAGYDLPSQEVGGDWTRFTATVKVTKKKARAEFRIWSTTKGVRVWFDDVEVKPVSSGGTGAPGR